MILSPGVIDRKILIRAMSWEELITLRMFEPLTYCINLSSSVVRRSLVDKGYIIWIPAQAWSGMDTYAITELGKEVRDALSDLSDTERKALRPRTDNQGQRFARSPR